MLVIAYNLGCIVADATWLLNIMPRQGQTVKNRITKSLRITQAFELFLILYNEITYPSGIDKEFNPTLDDWSNYLSLLGFK